MEDEFHVVSLPASNASCRGQLTRLRRPGPGAFSWFEVQLIYAPLQVDHYQLPVLVLQRPAVRPPGADP
jgi:hypothetical protein